VEDNTTNRWLCKLTNSEFLLRSKWPRYCLCHWSAIWRYFKTPSALQPQIKWHR